MAVKVKWITYTQFLGGYYDDNTELEEDEEIEEEYDNEETAIKEAKKDKYGTRGQFVEVYINDRYFRDYER